MKNNYPNLDCIVKIAFIRRILVDAPIAKYADVSQRKVVMDGIGH